VAQANRHENPSESVITAAFKDLPMIQEFIRDANKLGCSESLIFFGLWSTAILMAGLQLVDLPVNKETLLNAFDNQGEQFEQLKWPDENLQREYDALRDHNGIHFQMMAMNFTTFLFRKTDL
jgi:hypothetical protein